MTSSGTKIGELLVERGALQSGDLGRALQMQVAAGGRLGTVLIELRLVGIDVVGEALAAQHRVPVATQAALDSADQAALSAVPRELARKHAVVPLRFEGKRLCLAMRDPHDIVALDEISFTIGARLEPHAAAELRIFYYLERLCGVPRLARYLRVPDSVMQQHTPDDERRRYLQPAAEMLAPEPAFADAVDHRSYADQMGDSGNFAITPLAGDPRQSPVAAASPGPVAAPSAADEGELSLVYLDEFDVDVAVEEPEPVPQEEPSQVNTVAALPAIEGVPKPRRERPPTSETVGAARITCANCNHSYKALPPLIWIICPECGSEEGDEWSLTTPAPALADEERETALLANPALEQACATISDAADRPAVLRGLVGQVLAACPVSVLLSVRQQLGVGVAARGTRLAALELQALVVPLTTTSLLQRCAGEGAVLRGSFADDAILTMVGAYLRAPSLNQALVAPLNLGGRLFNLLLCGSERGKPFSLRAELELELLVGAAERRLAELATLPLGAGG